MADIIDVKTIVDLLTQRIEGLAAEVLPRGHREGRDWVEASTSKGGLGDSLKVCISGARRGTWSHFAAGQKGDALELVCYVMFSGDKKKAIAWSKSWLGLDSGDPKRVKQARLKAAETRKKAQEDERAQKEKLRKYVKGIWLHAQGDILDTPVDWYLQGRGIDLRSLAHFPRALRYAPSLKHKNGQQYPAMVAAIMNGQGQQIAVHRTYLSVFTTAACRAHATKAQVGDGFDVKMVLAGYAGGIIALARGASGKPLSQAPKGDKVILCEGIEDGLTLAMACPDWRVLATVSVGNMQNAPLPPTISHVVIAADNDAEGSPAAVAMQKAAHKFMDEGRDVRIARAGAHE